MSGRMVVTATLCLFLLSACCWAEERSTEARLEALESRLDRLERNLAELMQLLSRGSQSGSAASTAAPVREALTHSRQELGELRLGVDPSEAAQDAPEERGAAEAPAAGSLQAEAARPRVPINGYMELHLNHDNINPTTLDFHRFVLLFSHDFGDRIRFVSEVELEHALVEGGVESGEIELEQAYLNFAVHPAFNFRAGMMLTPIGIINQFHEPPSFNDVERPFVDEVIIPSTWFSNGAGLTGDFGKGFHYKAFVMSSLNAALFSAEEGFREGRQRGFFDNARNLAAIGRLEYRGLPGLNLGTSFWAGETGFDFSGVSGQLKIFEFDGRYSFKRFDTRGQFVITDLEEAGRINRILQLRSGVSPNLAERMRGFYWEGALHLLPSTTAHDLVGFYRYEDFDTQFRMPQGFLPLEQFDRSAHVFGVTYSPYPDVALKLDYVVLGNASSVIEAPNGWNFGIGWWF